MTNRLKDFYDQDEAKLVDLETGREIHQIIRDAGIAVASDPSKKAQFSDAAGESIKVALKRAEQVKYHLARLKTKAKLNFFRYNRDTKEFFILDIGSIQFKTKDKKYNQSTLFEILFEHWQKLPSQPIPISRIIKEASKRLRKEITDQWFKNTLRHLTDKIRASGLADYISIEREEDHDSRTTSNVWIEIVNPSL